MHRYVLSPRHSLILLVASGKSNLVMTALNPLPFLSHHSEQNSHSHLFSTCNRGSGPSSYTMFVVSVIFVFFISLIIPCISSIVSSFECLNIATSFSLWGYISRIPRSLVSQQFWRQTGPRSVQPFVHGADLWQTNRQTCQTAIVCTSCIRCRLIIGQNPFCVLYGRCCLMIRYEMLL